jgi:flagellar biosynthesis protein FlhG
MPKRPAISPAVAFCVVFPHSKSAQAFKSVAQRINSWPIRSQTGGHLEFFVERMIKYETQESAA